MGTLPNTRPLVTLVVTEDERVVRRECPEMLSPGTVLGCHVSEPVTLTGGRVARTVRIVRYTDRLPSAVAFEIDIHELCHAVAALQGIPDTCHAENGGRVEHYPAASPRLSTPIR
jgi:hypothetical protein